MTKIYIWLSCIMTLIAAANATPQAIDYHKYATELDLIEIIDSADLTVEMLENRNGKLIIERVIGVVDNAQTGAGHVLGNEDAFISYAQIPDISNGDVVCSYFIYNPDNNAIDDIDARYDYVIDDKE